MQVACPQLCVTAAKIAAALGCTPQAIKARLAQQPPSGHRIISGNLAPVWSLSALPVEMELELAAVAVRRGFENPHAMLENDDGQAPLAAAWHHPNPGWRNDQSALDKAVKLKSVLQPDLLIKSSDTRSQAQFEADGIARYQKVIGHPISGRWYRELFKRTIDRDSGLNDWERVEIYVQSGAGQTTAPRPATIKPAASLPEPLPDIIRTLDNPAEPTADDSKFLFDAFFRHFEDAVAAHPESEPALKRTLLDGLMAAVPKLARTAKSLRKMWNRKHTAWLLAGGDPESLRDARLLGKGGNRKPAFAADEKKIRDEAILHDGNISLAYRKLRQAGLLSEAFVKHYHFNARHNKSYVPRAVRDSITSEVKMCGPIHHGPWKAKMSGPYIPRDWAAVQPGDWISADDFTLNHVFSNRLQDLQLQLHRGECLIFIDLRTGYVLDYLLIAGHYNSRHIRKLILRIHDKFGLPWLGWYFERSVWAARIIQDLDSRENFQWRETESGLAAFGLQVRHATTPRAKTIEGLGRIWQERTRNEPGFVGFDERRDERESMQDYLARVRRGTADPGDRLLSMERWSARLDELFREYNNDPQNGKMLRGQSPAEAWQAGLERRPLRQLPQNARYLLSTHCTPVKIRQHGIVLKIGGNKMLFANEHTGHRIGQDALAFYNLDCPEALTVSDLNRQNYFTVKSISLPAMSATKEQFGPVQSAIASHNRVPKEIYGDIKRQISVTVTRDDDVSEPAKELGRFVNTETERHRQEQTALAGKSRTLSRRAAAAGLVLTQPVRDLDDAAEAAERLKEIRARRNAQQTQGTK